MWVAGFVQTISYYVVCESVCGATLGKWMIGAQVIGVDISPCRFSQAFIRTIGFFADALFFGLIGIMSVSDSPLKQRVGDHWAGTYVAMRRQLPEDTRSAPSQIVAITIVGFAVTALVHAAGEILQYLA